MRFASAERGRLSIALSRPTPPEVFKRLADVRLPRRAELFQVDEREAKQDSDDRNRKLIERELTAWVKGSNYHPMPVDRLLRSGAERYAEELESVCGNPPRVDLMHLGLGPDGHTASLLPGDPVLDVTDRWVAVTKRHKGYRRMTLTYPVIDAARLVVFIVTGQEKAEAVKRVLAGDSEMPAARVAATNVVFLVDREAASRI
jgi:6-phosphogluconolactonase/glucosamine-6-phosphate isomerase/deaminase